jgi:hypothetical protein
MLKPLGKKQAVSLVLAVMKRVQEDSAVVFSGIVVNKDKLLSRL